MNRELSRFFIKNLALGRRENKRLKDSARIKLKIYKKDMGSEICPLCYGEMTWCSICNMWSSNCCQDWGTCLCS